MDDLVSATLDDRIRYWLGRGFRLTTQTSTSASLSMRRRFNPAEFVVMPIYLIEWLGQREQTVYLAAVPDGRVRETATGMEQSAYRRMQEAPAWQRLVTVIVAVAIVLVVLWALNGARR